MSEIFETTPVFGAPPTTRKRDGQSRQGDGENHPAHPEPPGEEERDIDVVVSLMGIPADEATPGVREALAKVMRDFDRQREELERIKLRQAYLEQQQDRDPVLPVAGRLALMRRLSRALHRSEQSEMENTLLVIHVDGVDRLRLDHGAVVAQQAMAQIATRIQATLHETDFLASLGGYDLGVLMALSGTGEAEKKGYVLSAAIAAHPFEVNAVTVPLRVQWGGVSFVAVGNPEDLVAAADADLRARGKFTAP